MGNSKYEMMKLGIKAQIKGWSDEFLNCFLDVLKDEVKKRNKVNRKTH